MLRGEKVSNWPGVVIVATEVPTVCTVVEFEVVTMIASFAMAGAIVKKPKPVVPVAKDPFAKPFTFCDGKGRSPTGKQAPASVS
jgi:hypothetical protein